MSGAEPVQTIEVPESQTQHQGAQERETLSDPVPIECLKCGVQTSALESGVVIKLNGIQCPRCASVYQMMYRHMGGIPEGVSSMTAEQQKTFFKSSGSLLASAPKNGRWAMVKSALVKEMVAFRTSQVTRRVSEDYLPLSVWEKRGFDSSQIKAQGRKKDDLVDDDVWSIPSDTEGPAGPKVPKKGKEDDAAKAARKMANERARLWNTQCGLATKMLAPLSALEKGLGNTLVRYQKLDSFDPTMVDGLKEAASLVARWNHCAKKLINASEEDKVNNDPEGFDTDHAGMTSKLKASKDLMADAKWAVKTEKAEQAAKPKATPKVKTAPKRKAKTGGDIICWDAYGGLIETWFSCPSTLAVRCQKMDL
ncbi:Uncharacterized protein SCF082_LOCUS3253, partial [Durusdinium trenchii]